jgi:thiol-disulfide isomerase/thioredoxin
VRAAWLLLALVLSGCAAPSAQLRARAGDFAVVDLQAWDAQGRDVLHLTAVHAVLAALVPVRLPDGWDANATLPLPPAVRDALLGAAPGEARDTALVPPEQGFGPWREDRTIRMPLTMNVSRVQRLPASALEQHPVDPHCDACGVAVAYTARWANATWDARILGANGTTQDVLLTSTPPNGTVLELPDVWNANYQLWRSRLVGSDDANLTVEQDVRSGVGRTVLVGGERYQVRVDAANGTILADGNPSLARSSLRFHALLRQLAFPGSAAFPPAPDATLVDSAPGGARFQVRDLHGPVLLDFFATWCVTCKQELPVLVQAHRAHRGFTVVSVTVDPTDTADKVQAFARGTAGADWTWAFDPTGAAAQGFGVATLPREVLLDRDLRIRATSVGFHPWDELAPELAALD